MHDLRHILLAFVVFGLIACDQEQPSVQKLHSDNDAKVEVKVMVDGTIFADGDKVSLDQLRSTFAHLKEAGGTVWYYREAADGEPHPNAMEVMNLVVENQLPLTMSTKPDYSDSVGPEGVPQPR